MSKLKNIISQIHLYNSLKLVEAFCLSLRVLVSVKHFCSDLLLSVTILCLGEW